MTDQADASRLPSRYQRSKSMGIYWYNKASDLRGAAGLVWAGMEDEHLVPTAARLGLGEGFSLRAACWPVYLMLCGLALELLLKAAIVAQGKEPPNHHRIANIWDDAGLAATRERRGLLEILGESIYWAGRYPVPAREADFDRLAELSNRYLWDSTSTGPEGPIIRQRNTNLTWSSFNELWSAALASPAVVALFDDPSASGARIRRDRDP